MIIFGIVGKAGSGKSTLLNYLRQKGFKVFNSDFEVKALYNNPEVANQIREALNLSKESDLKSGVVSQIKQDARVIQKLEEILHPLIEQKIIEFIAKHKGEALFLEVPLLYESGLDKYCDIVVLIDVDEELRQKRLILRENYDIVGVLDLQQESVDLKKLKANYVLKNIGSIDELFSDFEKILDTHHGEL